MPRSYNPDHPRTRDRGGKRALQVYLPHELHAAVHNAARIEGVSASDYVADLLREKRSSKDGVRSWVKRLHPKYEAQTLVNGDCIAAMQSLRVAVT